jgi:hypothetical protein
MDALIIAVVGGVVASGLILLHSELEKKRERKSVATALLWEIDDFYKLSIRNVCRALKNASPADLGFYVKPLNFRTFTVFEATADLSAGACVVTWRFVSSIL